MRGPDGKASDNFIASADMWSRDIVLSLTTGMLAAFSAILVWIRADAYFGLALGSINLVSLLE